jgi:xanthine dehydrogenase accessory factor
MNEIKALLENFDAAQARGERCAMATVVSVEGSSYRQPGARMLVCESGSSTGTISAGRLEADVVEHAKRVIRAGVAKLVEYDNRQANEEMAWDWDSAATAWCAYSSSRLAPTRRTLTR